MPWLTLILDQPARLISELAESTKEHLRLAIFPLFMQHPELAEYVSAALQGLSPQASITLQCYTSAAVCLQQKYRSQLQTLFGEQRQLPALFFAQLGLPAGGDPQDNLCLLAARQKDLSGRNINRLGTYEHAAQRLLAHLEREKTWAG